MTVMCERQISGDHNIVVTLLTSSRGKLIVKDGNYCVTYKNAHIYNENRVIERYHGYTKADLIMSHVIYKVVNFLQLKSALDARSI